MWRCPSVRLSVRPSIGPDRTVHPSIHRIGPDCLSVHRIGPDRTCITLCVNLHHFVCKVGSLVIITLCVTSQTLSSSLAMAAAQNDVKEEVLTPQKTATARPPEPDDCVSGSPSQSKVQSMLKVYKQDDPDPTLKFMDFGTQSDMLEVACSSYWKKLLPLQKMRWLQNDMRSSSRSLLSAMQKRTGLKFRLWHSDFHIEICLWNLSLGI